MEWQIHHYVGLYPKVKQLARMISAAYPTFHRILTINTFFRQPRDNSACTQDQFWESAGWWRICRVLEDIEEATSIRHIEASACLHWKDPVDARVPCWGIFGHGAWLLPEYGRQTQHPLTLQRYVLVGSICINPRFHPTSVRGTWDYHRMFQCLGMLPRVWYQEEILTYHI